MKGKNKEIENIINDFEFKIKKSLNNTSYQEREDLEQEIKTKIIGGLVNNSDEILCDEFVLDRNKDEYIVEDLRLWKIQVDEMDSSGSNKFTSLGINSSSSPPYPKSCKSTSYLE